MKVYIVLLSSLFFLLSAGCDSQVQKSPISESTVQKGGGHDTNDDSIAPDEGGPPSFEESIPLPERDCGTDEINPETGGRIFVPNVDMVVSHLEIFTTDLGTWIRPTVKNQCDDPAIGELIILIRSDYDGDVGLFTSTTVNIPGHTEAAWGHALGVPLGAAYTVVANWGNGMEEANYGNNTCVRSTTGSCL